MAQVRHLGLFPFCVESLSGLTKEQAAEMFWQVRSWEVTASSGNLNDEEFGTQFLPPVGLVLTNNLTSELDLICRANVVSEARWIAESGELQGQIEEVLRAVAGLGFYEGKRIFVFSLGAAVSEIGGTFGATEGGEFNDGSRAGEATVELRSGIVRFDLFNRFAESTLELNVTIAPKDYWPYDP